MIVRAVPALALAVPLVLGVLAGCSPHSESKPAVPTTSVREPTPTAKVTGDPRRESNPPGAPDWFVFRPTFTTTEGEIRAGSAFFVRLPDHPHPILLTAIHLLGPAGGMAKDVPPADVPKVVHRLRLNDCFSEGHEIQFASEPLVIPEAAPLGEPGKAGDVLAFWGPSDKRIHVLELAPEAPGKDEPVWLVAPLRSGAPAEQRLHPASMVGITKAGEYVYRFDNPKLSIRGTSGAPVLNAAGELVAINLGGYDDDGKVFGLGNPVEQFKRHLLAAAKKYPKP
jgi:hypothetical protein